MKVVHVDYDSLSDLTNALKGQDAVVSTFSAAAASAQLPLIEASVAAGVKRFIPSEFSSDIDNPKSATLPVYQPIIAIHKALQAKSQAHPEFTYTSIRNGVLLDWGLAKGLIVALDSETPTLYDGGDRPFSVSNLASVGQAVIGVLSHFEETRNRAIYVHDLVITQNQVLSIAQKLAPERKWNPVIVNSVDLEAKSRDAFSNGVINMHSSMGFLVRAVFGEGYGGRFYHVDNELIGTKFKTETELEGLVKAALDRTLVLGS